MGDAIRHGFANLTNFAGRDPRQTFWYYVLFLVIINVVIGLVIGIAFTAGSIGGAMESAMDGASEADVQAQVMQQMAGSIATQAWIGVATSLVTLGLFIAAFVRRLRDAALPVAIAAIPIATSLFSAYQNVASADTMAAIMATGDPVAMNEAAAASAGMGMIGWLGYLVVIICGAIPTRA